MCEPSIMSTMFGLPLTLMSYDPSHPGLTSNDIQSYIGPIYKTTIVAKLSYNIFNTASFCSHTFARMLLLSTNNITVKVH
jgi:hypothetical protein